jgi:hypothetical protein
MKLQSAVKKETVAVAAGTGIGCLVLIALFLIMYLVFPESSVKFDYRVVLGALGGGAVAVANFFLMAVTVQSVVNVTNRDDALRMMRVSYRNRMLMRGIWIVIAIFAPCFNYAAGIIPLFIPSLVIKIRGIRLGITGKTAAGQSEKTSAQAVTEQQAETSARSEKLSSQTAAEQQAETAGQTQTTGEEKTEQPEETGAGTEPRAESGEAD